MRKTILLLTLISLFSFVSTDKSLTGKEREFAIRLMEETRDGLLADVKELNTDQINFKSDSTRWSVAQCVEHIAVAEGALISFVQMSLNGPADPSKRDSIKFTDQQVVAAVTDRSKKQQAPEILKPDGKFASYQAALDSFVVRRNRNIDFIKSSQADFRNHYFTTPVGIIDDYQAILLITAHSKRHTLQLEEVKASPGFPKN